MALTDMLRGRQVVEYFTNKSGGSLVNGDVVIRDTGNDSAVTTTTSGQSLSVIGVVQESIANNAAGRVCTAGYVPLVNVPASVTRGHFVETHTVAKQATGSSSRRTGSFGYFTTGGTTPTAHLFGQVDTTAGAGSAIASDTLWDAAGDLAVGSGADTATKLSIGATNGMALQRVSGAVAWALPSGHEFDYVQTTSSGNITATSDATANTIVTANAVTYDGSTIVVISAYITFLTTGTNFITVVLYDGSSPIGRMGIVGVSASRFPFFAQHRLTPSAAAKTYSIRAFVDAGTGTFNSGAGGAAAYMPSFIRQNKA